MTNKVKNVPELRFPEFSGEWEENILGDVVIIKSGWSPSNFEKKDASVLLIKVDDLNYSSRMINNSKLKVNENNKYKKIKKDSIIFPKRGAAILTNKVRILGIDSYMDSNMMALEPKTINSEFLFTFIGKTGLYKIADTSTIPQINNKHIEPYKILLPSSTEQKYIGDFFSKLDRQIELEEQKLEKLEEQKKGYIQQIFSHQLIFKDKNGAIYPEWKTLKIKDIAEILRGLTYKPEDIRVAGIRVLRSSNIIKDKFHTYKDDIFVDESVVKIPLVNKGDILITAANGSPKLVGKHAIIEKLDDESVAGGFMYILRSDNSKFIQTWMSTVEYKRIISRVQGGNGSIGNLSRKDLENGYITLPCDEEQNKIGSFFNKFDELIEKQNKKIDGLKERKKGFLQKMFV
ncbi:restriction endonuclease subunit S [Mammaliicoccus sciuri]|uniref:restriction endonuclease subunit S n=1 Tax=Mammaliicoccus sciuri TaxID=1296 RepID=UPI002DB7451F|nr:restriction endonuclease subunit S [Mammaliicoccus sciuri]MEB7402103.1 restriction endonuclease subunit S [Mammaliicoccus sciuri]